MSIGWTVQNARGIGLALTLRACEAIRLLGLAGEMDGSGFDLREGCEVAIVCSCGEEQAATLQDVIGESEQAQHGMNLGAAAQRELGEAPLAQSRVDAFTHA